MKKKNCNFALILQKKKMERKNRAKHWPSRWETLHQSSSQGTADRYTRLTPRCTTQDLRMTTLLESDSNNPIQVTFIQCFLKPTRTASNFAELTVTYPPHELKWNCPWFLLQMQHWWKVSSRSLRRKSTLER